MPDHPNMEGVWEDARARCLSLLPAFILFGTARLLLLRKVIQQ